MTEHTAAADQLAAQTRDARCCDALDPCASCRGAALNVRVRRHLVRVAQAEAARPVTVDA
jgi:hypothetical protein